MGAVAAIAASHLRRNRRSSALVALLLALSVAVVLAAVAGARRTDAALESFVAADKGADGFAAFALQAQNGTVSRDLAPEQANVQAVEGVSRTARFSDVAVELSGPRLGDRRLAVRGFIGIDPDGLGMLSRLRIVEGHPPDQARAGELLVDEELARDAGLAVGADVKLRVYTAEQADAIGVDPAAGVAVDGHVVGTVRRPTDLRDPQSPQLRPNDYADHQQIYLTAALWERTDGDFPATTPMVGVTVTEPARADEVLAAIGSETGAYPITQRRFLDLDGTFKGVARSVSLHSRGLQVFAAIVALAGLFLVGQTLGRQIVLGAAVNGTLRAIGMTPGQLRLGAVVRALPVAAAGTALGIAGAVALSPLTPLPGTVARRAELHPGLSVDLVVLLIGGLVAVVVATLAAALPSARNVRHATGERPARQRPTVASRLAAHGMPAPAVVGARFAFEPGRGSNAVPVRTAMVAAAAAVAVVLAAVAFSSSLSESRRQSRRYGVSWDVAAGFMSAPEQATAEAEEVRAIPGVAAFAGISTTAFETSAGQLPTILMRQQQGRVDPVMTSGRAPGRGEVALGALTMKENHLRIGDDLEVTDSASGKSARFEITGVVVLNAAGIDVSISPGRGALFDWSLFSLLAPEAEQFVAPQIFLVDAEQGRTAAVERRLRAIFPTSTSAAPVEPLDLTNLGDASLLPAALGLVVALLGVGTVTHAMLSAVRRRRQDLAVLKSIGFVRSQIRGAIVWQALMFGVVALAVGLPVGVLGGRAAWSLAAGDLGIPSYPVAPVIGAVVVAAALLLLLAITAVVPARMASRIPAAIVLRRD